MTKGSRGKSTAQQKRLLKTKGLGEEFPDALTVITFAVLRRILSEGTESSYAPVLDCWSCINGESYSYTCVNENVSGGGPLNVCSAPHCVRVTHHGFLHWYIGVGASRSVESIDP